MLRGCAFDLGNTLVDDVAAFQAAAAETDGWLHSLGLIAARGSFAATYTSVNRASHDPFVSHTYGEPAYFAEAFRRLGVRSLSPDEGLAAYRRFLMARMEMDPAAADGLRWLRDQGLKTALVTNESVARVEAFLDRTGDRALFDQIVVSQAVGCEKPDPAIFRETLRRLGLSGPEVAMLGDNEIADGACRAVGIRFVLVTAYRREGWRWESGAAHDPDLVIERVDRESLRRVLARFADGEDRRCSGSGAGPPRAGQKAPRQR